jgi:hypothetical protein
MVVGLGHAVAVELDAEARTGRDFHLSAGDRQLAAGNSLGRVDQPGVVRVGGNRELRNRRGEVDHRGHRYAGMVVAVLTQLPAE